MARHIHTATVSLLAMLSFVLVAPITEAESSPPSLFYSLLSLDRSKDYNVAVHCRKSGANTTFVTIMVAHRSSFNEAKGLALNIRRGMETGLFE